MVSKKIYFYFEKLNLAYIFITHNLSKILTRHIARIVKTRIVRDDLDKHVIATAYLANIRLVACQQAVLLSVRESFSSQRLHKSRRISCVYLFHAFAVRFF